MGIESQVPNIAQKTCFVHCAIQLFGVAHFNGNIRFGSVASLGCF